MSKATAGGANRRPYTRPMKAWWLRDPFFVRYMWREATALGVFAYAVVLTFGLVRLAQGPEAFAGWVAALKHPLSLLFHAVLLAAMVFHVITWFEVAPKSMPPMHRDGRRVPDATITRAGIVLAVVTNLALLALAWGMSR